MNTPIDHYYPLDKLNPEHVTDNHDPERCWCMPELVDVEIDLYGDPFEVWVHREVH